MDDKLVHLSDHEIRIDFALASKCRTNITIKSLISDAPVAFKVQTSSPHKFLVNPPSSLLRPLAAATFQIVLKPQPQIPPTFPRSPSDRFLLKTAVAPDLNLNSPEDSTNPETVNRWFNSHPHRRTYDVKLKVYFVGAFLLSHAAGSGDVESVKGILKRQRFVPELTSQESESLYRVADPYPEIVGLLLEAGLRFDRRRNELSVSDRSSRGWTELHVAAAFDRTDEIRRLVKERRGGGLDCEDKEGRAPLHIAAGKGFLETANVLVKGGACVDARSRDGRTAIYRAAANGDREMVEMLLEGGADPTIGDVEHCRSAVEVARDKGHIEVVKVLEQGEAVFHAARRGELELLESMLERGASTSFCDDYGLTPLHVAAIKGNKDAVMMLLEFGADVECRDNEGHTPLHLAVEGGNLETVEILVSRGANVNVSTTSGATTPLYISKAMEYEEITSLLLEKGASDLPRLDLCLI